MMKFFFVNLCFSQSQNLSRLPRFKVQADFEICFRFMICFRFIGYHSKPWRKLLPEDAMKRSPSLLCAEKQLDK
jgi:hypothetical protein